MSDSLTARVLAVGEQECDIVELHIESNANIATKGKEENPLPPSTQLIGGLLGWFHRGHIGLDRAIKQTLENRLHLGIHIR